MPAYHEPAATAPLPGIFTDGFPPGTITVTQRPVQHADGTWELRLRYDPRGGDRPQQAATAMGNLES